MRFWSASGDDVDRLDLVSDDPPELVRASETYRKGVEVARRRLEQDPGHVTISHHDHDDDGQVTVLFRPRNDDGRP